MQNLNPAQPENAETQDKPINPPSALDFFADAKRPLTRSQSLEQLRECLADKIVEEALADPQYAAEIEKTLSEPPTNDELQEPEEKPVCSYFKSIGRSDFVPVSGVLALEGIDLWGDSVVLRTAQILSIEPGDIVQHRYDIFDPLDWFYTAIIRFLERTRGLSAMSESQFEQLADMVLLKPLSKRDMEQYFIRPIYNLATYVTDCGKDRETNPILNLFFGSSGLFHKQPVVLADVMEELRQRQACQDSDLSKFGTIILNDVYEGKTLAVTYIPLKEIQREGVN